MVDPEGQAAREVLILRDGRTYAGYFTVAKGVVLVAIRGGTKTCRLSRPGGVTRRLFGELVDAGKVLNLEASFLWPYVPHPIGRAALLVGALPCLPWNLRQTAKSTSLRNENSAVTVNLPLNEGQPSSAQSHGTRYGGGRRA